MKGQNYLSCGSDNEDEVQILTPPPKGSSGIHKFKCLLCALAFASRKDFMAHSESHAQASSNNPNPSKRSLTQREVSMQRNVSNVANGVMSGDAFDLAIAELAKPVCLSPTRGAHVTPVPQPSGYPPKNQNKRPKNDHVDGGYNKMVAGTSGAGGGSGGNKGGSGSGSGGGSDSGGTVKKVLFFDLNLPPPPEED